jgi:transcription-repair coupling factor (superfamily II helicase)
VDLRPLLEALDGMEPLTRAAKQLRARQPVLLGAPDAAKPATAALLWRALATPTLLLLPRETDAEVAAEQLGAWAGDAAIHLPARGALPYERAQSPRETATRIAALGRLAHSAEQGPPLLIASAAAAAERTLRPADLSRGPGTLTVGERVPMEQVAHELVDAGYTLEPLVEAPGHAARRGGLLDVFPPDRDAPLRIEWFGSEIESIRVFDAESQRTHERLASVTVGPATEWLASREELAALAATLSGDATPRAPGSGSADIEAELAALRRGELPVPALYGPLLGGATLFDHLGPDALLIVDEREAVEAAAADLDELALERAAELSARGELPASAPAPHAPSADLTAAIEGRPRRALLARWATGVEPGALRLPFQPPDGYAGRLEAAAAGAARELRRGDRVVVVTQQAQRYREVLAEAGIEATVEAALDATPEAGSLQLVQGGLPEGWRTRGEHSVVSLVTDRELFGFVKQRRQLRRRPTHRSRFLAEVSPGDFVVHADHGIARFGGLIRREVSGEPRDYLELRYADSDRIYVPIEQVDRVARYVGPSDIPPRLTRLGTQEWTRARARARAAVEIVAADLVRLYAARQMLHGHAFSADDEWQRELEAAFPYEETPDQRLAIEAVKTDMEAPRPMDRVICGDVGFGKTEVAVRAAFKAVRDGHQVAVLVPTTVLAQQHLRTFRERLAAFPVRVEALSRFRTEEESSTILAGVRDGGVDVLIGTHRLLSPDVEFANLGLVVIDEEQRFGVRHKERLKRMRLEVDVLTLTATPIPRTLHMTLAGIRDLSMMESAPEGRQAVQTYVSEWDPQLVRDAVLHELERGGQIYLVHNRVRSIDSAAERLRELVPEARVAVAHGQMPERQLERVMERFADGEFDVLACTTIIESGLDNPNVNTLIVDRADILGLAQLYQLRGRVGRGAHQAYAYLLFHRDRALTEVAQQRLATIFEASELGSGFQVALRDLEIRGAGNLLGAEQSGQIAAIGFDLYTQMLAETVDSMKAAHDGGSSAAALASADPPATIGAPRATDVALDLPVAAYIPEGHVAEIEGRIALYQRIAGLATLADAEALDAEVRDRFGAPPPPLQHLLTLVRLRLIARDAAVASIRSEGREIVVTAVEGRPFAARRLPALPAGVQLGRAQLRLDRDALGEEWLVPLEALLRLLSGASATSAGDARARGA